MFCKVFKLRLRKMMEGVISPFFQLCFWSPPPQKGFFPAKCSIVISSWSLTGSLSWLLLHKWQTAACLSVGTAAA